MRHISRPRADNNRAAAQPALRDERRVARRIGEIGDDVHIDRSGVTGAGEQNLQPGKVLHAGDAGEIRLERRGAARFDAGFVHPAGIEIADLLTAGAIGCRVLGHIVEDGADIGFGFDGQLHAEAGRGAVRRDLDLVIPGAVGIGPEIVTGLDAGLLCGGVEAEGAVARRRRCLGERGSRAYDQRRACHQARQGLDMHAVIPGG